jgi:hypothetical protein
MKALLPLIIFMNLQTFLTGQTVFTKAGQGSPELFQVIPNPGNGIYTVLYKNEISGTLTISVSDATGKYVYLKGIRDFDGDLRETVDISVNPRGVYIFEVETDNRRDAKRVIYQ